MKRNATIAGRPSLLGVPIGVESLDALLDAAGEAIRKRRSPFTCACANPHSLVVAQQDEMFRLALQSCSAVIADGAGVKLAGRLFVVDVGPRITGMDFFLALMRQLDANGGKVFFLGSVEPVLARIEARIAKEFPRLRVDSFSPPFGAWTADVQAEVMRRIRASGADVLWVGMTAPKQEKWIHAHADECGVPVVAAIGAVFDYYAGTVRRAPDWVCSLGFEWLYRLAGEPKRLWRRTVISAPHFAWLLLRHHWRSLTRRAGGGLFPG